jgi:hypothetical protein
MSPATAVQLRLATLEEEPAREWVLNFVNADIYVSWPHRLSTDVMAPRAIWTRCLAV